MQMQEDKQLVNSNTSFYVLQRVLMSRKAARERVYKDSLDSFFRIMEKGTQGQFSVKNNRKKYTTTHYIPFLRFLQKSFDHSCQYTTICNMYPMI